MSRGPSLFPALQPAAPVVVLRVIVELDAAGAVVRTWSEAVALGAAGPSTSPPGLNGHAHPSAPPPPSASVPARNGYARPSAPRPPVSVQPPQLGTWEGMVAAIAADHELWEGYRGMSAADLLLATGVSTEIRCLQLVGVANAVELVIRYGAKRVRQVRTWADKQRQKQEVTNLPGLIARTLHKGVPKG